MLWCILRTSGGRTLALARSLADAGFDAWTPTLVTRRVLRRGQAGEREIETDAPILPTFVFVRAHHLRDLAHVLTLPINPHPPFSIFRYAGRFPLINEVAIAGLRGEEERAAESRNRTLLRRERIALLKTEKARQKALRAESRDFPQGAKVKIAEMPAMMGMTGVVVHGKGRTAEVCFGGTLTMKIAAWRVSPDDVEVEAA